MEKSLDSLIGNLEILDVRSSVHETSKEHVDVLEKHEECNEGEINLEEQMKFASMLQFQLLSPIVSEESKGNSTTSCLGEAKLTCK
jgi:hypothetical protein